MSNLTGEMVEVPAGRVIIRYKVEDPYAGIDLRTSGYDVPHFRIARQAVTNAEFQQFIDSPNGYANRFWWRSSGHALFSRRNLRPDLSSKDPKAAYRSHSSFDTVAYSRWLSHEQDQLITTANNGQWEQAFQQARRLGISFSGNWEWCSPSNGKEFSHFLRILRRGKETRLEKGSDHKQKPEFRLCSPVSVTEEKARQKALFEEAIQGLKAKAPYDAIYKLQMLGDPAAVPALIEISTGDHKFIAHGALARLGGDAAVNFLLNALDYSGEKYYSDSAGAITSIGLTGSPAASTPLLNFVKSLPLSPINGPSESTDTLKIAAIRALAYLDDPSLVDQMLQLIDLKDQVIQNYLPESIGKNGTGHFEKFVPLLKDTDPNIRRSGVTILEHVGDRRSIELLQDLDASEQDPEVKKALKAALKAYSDSDNPDSGVFGKLKGLFKK